MNERQSKLKSILDRWTACTLTIEQAETEIAEINSDVTVIDPYVSHAFDIPTMFLEAASEIPMHRVEAMREHFAKLSGGKCQLCVLPPKTRIVRRPLDPSPYQTASESIGVQVEQDVHKYWPESVHATVGNFEVFCDSSDRSKFSCTIDGIDVRHSRRIEIVIAAGERPSVKIEFCPKSIRRDKDSDAS